ncbi:L-seryl-tRNA(Sec) selenium transferase [uncultured Desulfatiglans sp.]|nr:L-seryl-tRNA(Sec) selenium transferase [uncultured Desulfatiglans sp.]
MGNEDRQLFLRKIPGVDRLLGSEEIQDLARIHPRALILKAIHQVLEDLRARILEGGIEEAKDLDLAAVLTKVRGRVEDLARPSLRPVINATGVVAHTNLGRSILAERVIDRFRSLAGGYSNLEYDLKEGRRGSRYVHVEGILRELTSAEAAMVVNNNAAAVLIALETLAKGREVIVSRGQLVEIGGSFRIPDVMRKSGATMIEVGTTNKTHLKDYEEAIRPETALLLKVHTSNFQVVGFTKEVPLAELAELGRRYGLPVMEDLGSGCFVDLDAFGLSREPTVQEVLAQGADLVTFSGDKLLGGPQAGIILGRRDLVAAIRGNQLNRALRIDKLTLLALEETLRLYRDPKEAIQEIPTLRMILQPLEELRWKARSLMDMIGLGEGAAFGVSLCDGSSKVGGGALPLLELPTCLVCLDPGKMTAQSLEKALRASDPPVIARVEHERVMLDVRTIQTGEMTIVAQTIHRIARGMQ